MKRKLSEASSTRWPWNFLKSAASLKNCMHGVKSLQASFAKLLVSQDGPGRCSRRLTSQTCALIEDARVERDGSVAYHEILAHACQIMLIFVFYIPIVLVTIEKLF